MRQNLLTVFLGLLFLQFTAATARPQSIQPPEGWSSSRDGANMTYTPDTLPASNKFAMTVFPAESLQSQDRTGRFTQHPRADLRPRGAVAKLMTPRRNPSGLVSETLSFRDNGGQNWMLIYAAAQTLWAVCRPGTQRRKPLNGYRRCSATRKGCPTRSYELFFGQSTP